tara:strand:- start:736 stop:1350 length:615 start_codon:yes stop_codon:yes gene_type:complete
MSEKIIHKLFVSPVFQFKIENYETLNKQLSEYIYDLKKNDAEGIQRSNVNGWHSKNFKIEKENTPYNFVKAIHGHIKEVIVEGFGWKYVPEKVGMSEIWAIINKKGTFNKSHNHPGSYLSAAYYVKAPKNCGNINFYDPNEIKKFNSPAIENLTELSTSGFSIKPEEGNLLIFPSYLYHDVGKNLSDDDRIVISFNVSIIPSKN